MCVHSVLFAVVIHNFFVFILAKTFNITFLRGTFLSLLSLWNLLLIHTGKAAFSVSMGNPNATINTFTFLQSMDMLKLAYLQLKKISLFWFIFHVVRVKKRLCFGLQYLLWSPQT